VDTAGLTGRVSIFHENAERAENVVSEDLRSRIDAVHASSLLTVRPGAPERGPMQPQVGRSTRAHSQPWRAVFYSAFVRAVAPADETVTASP
jgi:hypothetical protein